MVSLTYLALNCAITFAAVTLLGVKLRWPSHRVWALSLLLVGLTLLFDTLIIATGNVAYDPTKLLGIFVGIVPIEDFGYTILAIIIIPALWRRFDTRRNHVRDN